VSISAEIVFKFAEVLELIIEAERNTARAKPTRRITTTVLILARKRFLIPRETIDRGSPIH